MIAQQASIQHHQLLSLLQDEIRHTKELFEFMELEAEALATRDIPALENVTRNKFEHIRQLEALGQQRARLLATQAGDPLTDNSQLSSLWQELLAQAAKCQEKNRINGGVIDASFRQSQQALDILQGKSGKAELYNHSGQATRSGSSGSLARA